MLIFGKYHFSVRLQAEQTLTVARNKPFSKYFLQVFCVDVKSYLVAFLKIGVQTDIYLFHKNTCYKNNQAQIFLTLKNELRVMLSFIPPTETKLRRRFIECASFCLYYFGYILLCLIVGQWGIVKLQNFERKHSSSLNYYKRMT